ncbi:metallophosphoesterase [Candidatus Gracilibacteria bacterium]|nr:metallophosphoesterase [Candidatus Gracilibacteria bacterium]MCF7819443.1 metallophosphoesterase [Candidatus Gracilibacteria bacterium]
MNIPALIGEYPTSFFVFEFLTWGLVFGGLIFGIHFLRQKKYSWGIFFLLMFLIVVQGSFFEPRKLVVREFEMTDPDLPPLRIALLADIHVGPYKSYAWTRKLVQKLNSLENIEAVVLPGDFVFGGAQKYGPHLFPLRHIRAVKKWATLGNHDHDIVEPRNTEQSQTVSYFLREYGLQELKNTAEYWPEKDLWIVGTDDNDLDYHDLDAAYEKVGGMNILLAHSPDIVDDLGDHKPNLILSGHTHCGQIRLPFLGALPFTIPTENGKKLESHLYEKNGNRIFITCGVGEVGPRARLLNPPEIVILNINQ